MMEELVFHNSQIVSVSLAVCAVLATVGAMILARNMLFMSTTSVRRFFELRFRPTALRYTEEFECIFEGYQEKALLLGNYTPNYSIVFNEAKWAKIVLTLDSVSRAYEELCGLLEQGESKDALCLAEFLIAAGEELPPWKYRRISDEWAPLAHWESEAHTTICDVVKNLWSEVQRSRSLGISRGASIDETMKVLQKIREKL
jgi:hypothetical protein